MTAMQKLIDILDYLRTHDDGCAWTKAQTHASLVPHLLEESYEAAGAIDEGKTGAELRDELGDVLLQIVFHAQIAAERKAFTFEDVAQSIVDKLERRYPTILGDEPNTLKTPAEIDKRWEEIKAQERGAGTSAMDGISRALPALMRAAKLKGRAAKAGWEWPDVSMLLDKIDEEARELRAEIDAERADSEKVAAEVGDLMFMLVNFARWHDIDAEDALRKTNDRFETRFRHMEQGLKSKGKDFRSSTQEERMALWDEAKLHEKKRKAG